MKGDVVVEIMMRDVDMCVIYVGRRWKLVGLVLVKEKWFEISTIASTDMIYW